MLYLRAVIVAYRLTGSSVETPLFQRRRQSPRRHVHDRRILLLSHYSLTRNHQFFSDSVSVDLLIVTFKMKQLVIQGSVHVP